MRHPLGGSVFGALRTIPWQNTTRVRRRRRMFLRTMYREQPPGPQILFLQSIYGNELAPYYTLEGTIPLVFTLQNEL